MLHASSRPCNVCFLIINVQFHWTNEIHFPLSEIVANELDKLLIGGGSITTTPVILVEA